MPNQKISRSRNTVIVEQWNGSQYVIIQSLPANCSVRKAADGVVASAPDGTDYTFLTVAVSETDDGNGVRPFIGNTDALLALLAQDFFFLSSNDCCELLVVETSSDAWKTVAEFDLTTGGNSPSVTVIDITCVCTSDDGYAQGGTMRMLCQNESNAGVQDFINFLDGGGSYIAFPYIYGSLTYPTPPTPSWEAFRVDKSPTGVKLQIKCPSVGSVARFALRWNITKVEGY